MKPYNCNCIYISQVSELKAQKEELLRFYEPWSTKDILNKLIEASRILLIEKSYDGHGYELINEARDQACQLVMYIETKIESNE